MSEEKIIAVLKDFGLTESEAEVYLFLARHGVLKGTEVAKQLKKDKGQVYHLLKSLQFKGLVESTLEVPTRFAPVPFQNVVESNIKAKRAEAARVETTKQELLDYWKGISKTRLELPLEKFMVIEGNQKVYSKISQMITETKNRLSAVATVAGLLRADQFGLYDVASKHSSKATIQFRFLTELSSQNLSDMKTILKKMSRRGFDFRVRNPEFGLSLFPRMVIRDNEESLFFITPRASPGTQEQDDLCLWTNCKSLVQAFTTVFEDFWRNSTSTEAKITEIETGKPAPKTQIIGDAETASRKYNETVQAAEKEITMITSSKGLVEIWKNKPLLTQWVQKGVAVKIMAPVTSENMEAVQQLSKQCEVKHIPVGFLGTSIIDGKHLFQLKATPQDYGTFGSKFSFENTFYTNDFEYVEKTRIMLNDVWRNAQTPSTNTLKSIGSINSQTTSPISDHPVYKVTQKMANLTTIEDEETSGRLTEKVVIDKIIKTQKYPATVSKGIVKTYSTNSQAIIHPPSHLNLPDILLHTYHMEKHSTYGAEDAMLIHMWSNTPKGYFYVHVATLTDNPEAMDFWKKVCAGSPAGQNVQLVKKEEFEVRISGTALFAVWTVPIPLVKAFTLPPACLLVEGYGGIKTNAFVARLPSDYTLKTQGNVFEAFITFLHPLSKYSGPGTDGVFGRDIIMEFYPPRNP